MKCIDKVNEYSHCVHPVIKKDIQVQPEPKGKEKKQEKRKEKKKDSTLSRIAIMFSLFTCTFPVGYILALIDLCKNDKTERHIGSWYVIIVGTIVMIAVLPWLVI